MKPKVVFFGGNVPPDITEKSLSLARSADTMLVVGSTLSTWSAMRLAKATVSAGGKLAIINFGATRADELATVRVAAHTSAVLSALVRELGCGSPSDVVAHAAATQGA